MAAERPTPAVPPDLDGSFLSAEQLQHFHEFGYVCVRQMFTPQESQCMREEFNLTIDEHVLPPRARESGEEYRRRVGSGGAGAAHDGSVRTMIGGPIEHRMSWVLDHPKMLGLLGGVIGTDFNYCSGDGNYYTGNTSWHPDGNWGQLFAVKVALYLEDELDASSGALRLIPGSHRPEHPLRSCIGGVPEILRHTGCTEENFPWAVAVPTKLGDVVMFNHDIFHASFNGSRQRRMFTLNCTRRPKSPADTHTFRKYISIHSPGARDVITGGGMFYPPLLRTANAARWLHLEQAARVHDELFPHLSAKATAGKLPHEVAPERDILAVRAEIDVDAAQFPQTPYRPWEDDAASMETIARL
jgi:hypothetical protein